MPGDAIHLVSTASKPRKRKLPAFASARWLAAAQVNRTSDPLPNLANAMLALREDERLAELLAYDEMGKQVILAREVPGRVMDGNDDPYPRPIRDDDVSALQVFLQQVGLETLGTEVVHRAVDMRARERAFHPVRDYLNSLAWDGTRRIDRWLTTFLGSEDTPYHRGIGRMFLVAMVARIFEPGCQADYMPILEGPQGLMKSSACKVLGGQWFSDSLPAMSADAVRLSQHLRGKWLIEVGEMSAMSKADSAELKAFITRRAESFTPKFGRCEVHEPRQCVFIGTTNEGAYLRDSTGARRFWPAKVHKIDIDGLARDRDRLFAEAVMLYRQRAPWWPDRSFEQRHIRPQQDARYEADAWQGAIAAYVAGRPHVTVVEVAREGVRLDLPKIGVADQRRISAALDHMGWWRPEKGGRGPNGERFFYPPPAAV